MGYYQRSKKGDDESEAVEMIDPKTNWVASDNFGVTDYSRITSNLNEAAEMVGVSTVSYPLPTYARVLDASYRRQIVNQYAAIAGAMGWKTTVAAESSYWFNWIELNAIEQLCVDVITAEGSVYQYGDQSVEGTGTVYGGGSRG